MEKVLFDFIEQHMPISAEEKQLITELSMIKSFKKGMVLLKEGKLSIDRYFVLKGCLRTYYLKDGEEKTTEFFTEFQALNPPSAMDRSPSPYYISCVEDCVLLISNPDADVIAFTRFPKFEMMCRVLTEKLIAKKQLEFDQFKTSSPEERYVQLLEARPELFQRVPLHQLASYLGITPQSLSRLRARLVKK